MWQQQRGPKASKKALKSIRTIRIKEVPDCGEEVLLQPALVNFKKKHVSGLAKFKKDSFRENKKGVGMGKSNRVFHALLALKKGHN